MGQSSCSPDLASVDLLESNHVPLPIVLVVINFSLRVASGGCLAVVGKSRLRNEELLESAVSFPGRNPMAD